MPPRYPIRAVSKLTGLSVDTLRAWERRYRVVEPARDERGRLYSEADVERLRLLRQAVAEGHAIGRLSALPTDELRALVGGAPSPEVAAAPADLSALRDAVDRFDAGAFRRELSRLAAVLPGRALAREVALPFLHLVGEAWHEGRLSAAQEHLVSAELRSVLGALARLYPIPPRAPRLLLATPAGEPHELGTLAATLVAAGAGCAAIYLGPSLPAAELVLAARRLGPRAVVLGCAGGVDPPPAPEVLEVARGLPRDVELWVGGEGAVEAAAQAHPRALVLPDFDAFEKALARVRR